MCGVKNLCRRLLWLGGMATVVFAAFMFVQVTKAIADTNHNYEFITSDTTWTVAGNPHIITGYVYVNAGAKLTIDPGCIVRFKTGAYLSIGNGWDGDGTGTLIADGDTANQITFDAKYASWYAIRFYDDSDDNSIMDNCIVSEAYYGIECSSASPTIQYCTISGGYYGITCSGSSSPSIHNCAIQNIDYYGIYINDYNSAPNISNNTISDCGEYGIYSNITSSTAVISNNVCNNNGLYPIALHPMGVISTGNSGSGNGTDAILINSGIVTSNTTWVDQETGFDYVIDSTVRVDDPDSGDVAILTIAPGFLVKFGGGGSIQIGYYWYSGEGALSAVGTDVNPITFTSKQGSPAPGDWSGIYFYDETRDADTILEHCRIEYAYYGVYCSDASPLIRCSDIKDNYYGVLSAGSTDHPSIQYCNITGNIYYGVTNWGNTTDINAKNNWWGAADGPANDGGGCASGSGDKVSCYVDYASLQVAYHTCTASSTAIELASFTAVPDDDDGVTLAWETATELDNAGFNVYRSKRKDGAYQKINNTLITSKGNEVSGANYSFEDTPGHGAFYYKLEDVDTSGVSTMHGPEKARVRVMK